MLAQNSNVVKFENENTKVLEHINNYLIDLNKSNRDFMEEKKGKKSKTQEAYEADVRLYFHLMKKKEKGLEFEHLTFDDIKIDQDNFEEYIEVLCSLKDKEGKFIYVNKTINRKITALKSFIRFTKKKKVISDFDISYLEIIKGEKERKVHYGVLEPDEVLKMAELAWATEREKGHIKRLLILTGFKTGLRIGELLSLGWKNFIKTSSDVTIQGVGKNNKPFEIKITNDLFDELLTLNKGQDKVFQIGVESISPMLTRLKTRMEIPKERRIVFHSVRKAFGTLIWKMTGDIEQARRALRHENVTTTQIYLGADNFETQNAVYTIDKIENDLYKKASHEDLLSAIANCPKNIQLILNMKLSEVLNGK